MNIGIYNFVEKEGNIIYLNFQKKEEIKLFKKTYPKVAALIRHCYDHNKINEVLQNVKLNDYCKNLLEIYNLILNNFISDANRRLKVLKKKYHLINDPLISLLELKLARESLLFSESLEALMDQGYIDFSLRNVKSLCETIYEKFKDDLYIVSEVAKIFYELGDFKRARKYANKGIVLAYKERMLEIMKELRYIINDSEEALRAKNHSKKFKTKTKKNFYKKQKFKVIDGGKSGKLQESRKDSS